MVFVLRSVQRAFWQGIKAGLSTADAAVAAGASRQAGEQWFRNAGGMPPLSLSEPSSRFLTIAERERIAVGVGRDESIRRIAAAIGRAPSTVQRELKRNRGQSPRYRPKRTTRPPAQPAFYSPSTAQGRADRRMARPKPSKISGNARLRAEIEHRLTLRLSPQQISHRLRADFPEDESMRISHEAIYRSLFVQGRGELRRELSQALRSGRAVRKPRARVRREAGPAGAGRSTPGAAVRADVVAARA